MNEDKAIDTRPLILYHADCPDGFCAAWAAWRKFGDGAEYVPVQYGQEPPDCTGRNVYIFDFSYKFPTMVRIIDRCASLVVLDHHATAEKELAGLGDRNREGVLIRFDMGKSGGRLAWEHFHPKKTAPWIVDYTEDRDFWRWKLPNSREVNAGLASFPFDFAKWDDMGYDGGVLGFLEDAGRAILRYQSRQVEAAVKRAREVLIEGHAVLACNATTLISEIAGKLAEGRPFGAAWMVRGDGKRVWSLRSTPSGIDVSEIAKLRGGGGHRNAAGFEEVVA